MARSDWPVVSPAQVLLALGDYMNVQCHSCIGGTNVGEDIRKLDYGQHVVAGTPGRVFGESGRRRASAKAPPSLTRHFFPQT